MILGKVTTHYCIDCDEPVQGGRIGGPTRCKKHRQAWRDHATTIIERGKIKSAERKKAEEGLTREY